MKERKRFPVGGIYAVRGGICDSYYLTDEDKRRYRYVTPAEYVTPRCCIGDCYIVDETGKVNPGTIISPVPFSRSSIGRRVA